MIINISDARMNAMGRHVQYGAASMTPHGGTPNWPTLAYQGSLACLAGSIFLFLVAVLSVSQTVR